MGGSKTEVVQASAPAQPSTAEAINAYIAGLPQMFQAQLDYAPKEAAQQVELAQLYAGPLGQALKAAQESLYPTQTGLTELLAQQAKSNIENPVSDAMTRYVQGNVNAGLGTNAMSGAGDVFKAKTFANVYDQQRQNAYNLAASAAGLGNVANAQMPSYTNQLSQYNPSSVMNYMSNNYGTYAAASRPLGYTQGQSAMDRIQQGMQIAGGMGSMMMMSSRKFKNDINPSAIDGIDVLRDVDVVDFKYNGSDKQQVGFIIEDSPDILADGDKVDTVNLFGVLIDAVKRLDERLENIERAKARDAEYAVA